MLNIIYYPVSAILWFWHKAFGFLLGPDNGIAWALAVVFLVFTLRALLYKPFVSQVRSMRKMQEFAPEIQKLKAKYGDDRQKMAVEMQKLQSQHGFNPLGGCLPILVQIPVFIGLFHVLRSFNRPFLTPEQNRQTGNYVFSADDVASFLDARLFGVPLSAFITEPAELLARYGDVTRVEIGLIAVPLTIIAGVLTHLTARHSVARQTEAQAANPQTAMMNKALLYLLPVGVVAGGPFFPLAILIYWLSNNLWTLGQQHLVYRRIDVEEAEKKETAQVRRESLGPKPGQKPARQKKDSPGGSAQRTAGASDESDELSAPASDENTSAAPNGAGPAAPRKSSNGTRKSAAGSAQRKKGVSGTRGAGTTQGRDGVAKKPDGSAPTAPGTTQPRPGTRKKTNRKRH